MTKVIPYPVEETEPWYPEFAKYKRRRKRKAAISGGLLDIVATAARLCVTPEKVRGFVRDGDLKFYQRRERQNEAALSLHRCRHQ